MRFAMHCQLQAKLTFSAPHAKARSETGFPPQIMQQVLSPRCQIALYDVVSQAVLAKELSRGKDAAIESQAAPSCERPVEQAQKHRQAQIVQLNAAFCEFNLEPH
eukprot:CAMPEP_0115864646 /NCGR_PEP_ID=MMETSP0287-20121206/19307_1 /TAXON_ID=412157 /ORGANISM="Chrysochromulina rotalis, Strain UIO044" /LENGTH=104 /DNA_ID=CAMNT_0003319121 /DNA_START=145 /DNA_END=460 /DNA_ORIENTATION=+